nr:nucleotidyltransferase family protein [Roseospira goensis]
MAAGLGRRMGGPNKLLRDLHGAPVVRHAAAALAAALPDAPRVVVTGRDAEAVAAALAGLDYRAVASPDPAAGLGVSLATGVVALPGSGLDGIMVALGDMPTIAPASVAAVAAAWGAAAAPERAIARPVHGGRPGHPVLWGCAHRAALAGLDGDIGGRALLQARPDRLIRVPVADPGVVLDIDRPADLAVAARALAPRSRRDDIEKQWSSGGCPS